MSSVETLEKTASPTDTSIGHDQMNIVIVGHVDHGKSTVIGRLMADTDSLPKGKLEQVKAYCAANSRPFEYAYLLDALKDEQSQGITIDSARCFFKTKKRHYIIIDAPGHIEFLKNMISGAARAEAALLVIDAKEGVQENSKRHGHMVSMLGIKQVVVLVNKLDLVDYQEDVFKKIQEEYSAFLKELNVTPITYIPISALQGDNIAKASTKMPWYNGPSILEQMDLFAKQVKDVGLPFRMPVQDIYKFTEENDDRRIVSGTIDSGTISVGQSVVFYPSLKSSTIKSIEAFSAPEHKTVGAGMAIGFTLTSQIYIRPGELMVRGDESDNAPHVSTRFKVNIFWMGKAPMIKNKQYKLKIAAKHSTVRLVEIVNVLDASDLSSMQNKQHIDRHDVAEIILETSKPIAFDLSSDLENTGRFVIVDNYEIAGGGIILDQLEGEESILKEQVQKREFTWAHSSLTSESRASKFGHKPQFILFTGDKYYDTMELAMALEKQLFQDNCNVYYLGAKNLRDDAGQDMSDNREEQVRRMGELARILTDSGQIFISTIPELDRFDIQTLQLLSKPYDILVVNVGENYFQEYKPDMLLKFNKSTKELVADVISELKTRKIIG